MFQCFETKNMRVWNFHHFLFQFVLKRLETSESVVLENFRLFQFVSVGLLYNLYVGMFRNKKYGVLNFHLLSVSICFETSESGGLRKLFALFHFFAEGLLYNLYVSMFRNKKYGVWNFHLFLFQFVFKRFETSENVDLENFRTVSICCRRFTI